MILKTFIILLAFFLLQDSASAKTAKKYSTIEIAKAIWPKFKPSTKGLGEIGRTTVEKLEIKTPIFLPNHILVLALTDTHITDCKNTNVTAEARVEYNTDYDFYLLKTGSKLTIADHISVASDPFFCVGDQGNFYSSEANLDLAPYRINEEERAFGYRVTQISSHANEYSRTTTLFLYQLKAGKLAQVLKIEVEKDEDLIDEQHEHTVITIGPKKKNNGFIWRATKIFSNPEANTKETKIVKDYYWNGESYEVRPSQK